MQRILIVDDDESMRGLLRARLSDSYEIIDYRQSRTSFRAGLEHKPEAIFLDLMMPKFSGFELCQSLRSVSYTSRIPIFVISGEAGITHKKHCEDLGATAYFEKPVDFIKLKGNGCRNSHQERGTQSACPCPHADHPENPRN
ncbi:MAG: hypothetical protein AUH15_01640 [Acidobacteriales bacterium 13_2_20CM_55_8]|nr:MAG: hypothetical protein AUH15_01640 [Acidobacteriales bacterium 13_2_20CM_55_8]